MESLPIFDHAGSVLENHHAATAFALAKVEGADPFGHFTAEERRRSRASIIKLVLDTDLKNHFTTGKNCLANNNS